MDEDGELHKETMVRFERLLPGPAERVWDYLTKSEYLAVWFGGGDAKYVVEPRSGGTVSLADGHILGVVTEWKPPRVLAYTWNVFAPGEAESKLPQSYVMFELKPQGSDVLLVLTHRPVLEGFEGPTRMGWHTFLDRLRAMLRAEEPEAREILMERNRVRYGVEKIPRP